MLCQNLYIYNVEREKMDFKTWNKANNEIEHKTRTLNHFEVFSLMNLLESVLI